MTLLILSERSQRDEFNKTKKVTNNDSSGSHLSFKKDRWLTYLGKKCAPLGLPIVTFLDVVGFVLLRSLR